ncbi:MULTISPECIES: hypothetical protein [Aeromonas]|uniref:ABC transporter substrate-binding protein n=1 Tax=Aeromonas sanarellii TaxID=633415 RepID=A0ABS4B3M4_9GAMM|nr:hypothetical protein [Aeromonas sanarellii]MBP0602081.1 hypothetical protein [Aeromonas sanarellii]MEB6605483.1 hypothetical protein [Aeromonas sanarellii]
MVRLLLLCSLLIVWPLRADTLHVYCDDWPGFCQRDGSGIYLDLVRAIYEPEGYVVQPHLVPYKRALAVVQKGGDMAMGVYREEVDGVHQPDYPDSADDVTVVMQKRWLPLWTGEASLKEQEVLWLRGWAFDKFIPVPMRWHEIDSHEMALQLLVKGRYRYYLTAGVLYPKGSLPPELAQVFLRWIPTYPIFADNERGRQLHGLWDPGMRTLARQGKLAQIYRKHRLYDYFRDFIREQEARARKPLP